jgi:hypothetical protein
VLYGSWELYIARDCQFERYGYTAFSLTLVPYIAISLLNLLATILEPQYPCVFLVQHKEDVQREEEIQPIIREVNDLMGGAVAVGEAPTKSAMGDTFYGDHAMLIAFRANNNNQYIRSRFLRCFGVVSNIAVSDISATNPRFAAQVFRDRLTWKAILLAVIATVLGIGAYLAPYVVALILTRFEPQQSSWRQRQWITNWLISGEVYGILGLIFRPNLSFRHWSEVSILVVVGTLTVVGMGVWVFVAKMILEGGICKIM